MNRQLQLLEIQLSDAERTELSMCEAIVEAGMDMVVKVGTSLLTIRDKRLYREQFATFEAYCQERWQISRAYAYRLMDAAQVVGNLSPIGDSIPLNESQARPLSGLEPDEQRIVWEVVRQTAPNGDVTAGHVKSVVNVFKEVMVTGALDDGSGEQIAVSDLVKAAITEETYERMKRQKAHIAERQQRTFPDTTTLSEWYTPPGIVERVRHVLGDIALDPCSTAVANEVICAGQYYDMAYDGLSQPWKSPSLYIHPPPGDGIDQWVNKLLVEYESDHVQQAIALLPAQIETAWFKALRDRARCFLNDRLKFWTSGGNEISAPFPSMAVYFGNNLNGFAASFRDMGDIYVRLP